MATCVLGPKFKPVTVTVVVGEPAITAAGVSDPSVGTASCGVGCTSVSWMSHMLRPCVAARKMREVGRMARDSTGEFGNPSPTTVQFVQGVAASGSGQEKTPTSVAI